MTESVAQQLDKSVAQNLGQVSQNLAAAKQSPDNFLETIDGQAKKIEHELSQYMKLAKRRIRDGFYLCIESIEELARVDSQIDLEELQNNVNTAFSRFDSVASAKDMCAKAVDNNSWKELLGLTDTSMNLLYRGAKQLFDKGNHPQAEAAFFFLTTVDFAQCAFWLGLGHAAFHLGNLNQAINAYETADSCQPGAIWPHIYMANCFEALNEYQESLLALQEAERELQSSQDQNHELEIDLQERIANAKMRA